jgi:uncharacterized protein involved in exopolysaccharide biosynthesis
MSRFNRYLTVILRWLVITSVVFVLTFITGFYITEHLFHKVYTATAQIQIRARNVTEVPGLNDDGIYRPTPVSFEAEFSLMQSPEFLLPVIYDLGLDKAWAKRVDKSSLDALPPQDGLLPQDALAYMNKILKLDFVRGTNIINITASSDLPTEAANIANAIADRYKTMRDIEEDQHNSRGADALRNQIAQQQKVVEEKKAEMGKLPQGQSPAYLAAQRVLKQQQSLLDALNVRLKQDIADRQLQESPVRIVSRAEPPENPSRPNKGLDFIVTILAAGFLSVMAASFVEIILLFLRASESPDT